MSSTLAFISACATGDNVGSTLLVTSGVIQAVGIVLMGTSFAFPDNKPERVAPTAALHVVPVSFAGGGGVGAVGRF